jgi:hypothetical protein
MSMLHSYLHFKAKYINLNSKSLHVKCCNVNTKCGGVNTKCIDVNCYKSIDLNMIQNTKIERYINTYRNASLSINKKATYKDLNHRINYCKLSLSRDIEVNPGPTFVNPSKTIHAPYS